MKSGLISFYTDKGFSDKKIIKASVRGVKRKEVSMENLFCDKCIRAIRSRGETIFVGDAVYDDDNEGMCCSWCKEPDEPLFQCSF